jgi:cell wall-associated NlpC family hydrolase
MRHITLIACLLALTGASSHGAAAMPAELPDSPGTASSWAAPEIRAVVARGALAPTVALFRPDDPLTGGDLDEALATLGLPSSAPADPDRLVVLAELDAKLVTALGLADAARTIRIALRDAALQPTPYVGTETIARLLGLRVNHPQGTEYLELEPGQPATRAEAAYSLAHALTVTAAQASDLRRLVAEFRLPALTTGQQAVLMRALRFVGYPYVWAGSSEHVQQLYYGLAPGGFDCSGLVWRVYKQPFADAPLLGASIRGRTTFAMSAERPKADRVPLDELEPGDLVFFGSRGPASVPAEVGHMGIAVAPGWFVHSSGNGVTLQPLLGWYLARFAWARRPLREAGLA